MPAAPVAHVDLFAHASYHMPVIYSVTRYSVTRLYICIGMPVSMVKLQYYHIRNKKIMMKCHFLLFFF